jgi:PhnB protein
VTGNPDHRWKGTTMRAIATPKGYQTLNPFLRVEDVAAAIDFYTAAFAAREQFRRELDGKLWVAVLLIGDSHLMLVARDVEPTKPAGGDPRGNGLGLKIYVDGVDEVFERAIGAGATREQAVKDQFFGERSGDLTDPFGFTWRLAQLLEEVPHDEIECRMRQGAAGT